MSTSVSTSSGPALPALRYAWAGLRTLRSTWVLSGLVVLSQLCFALVDTRTGTTGTEQFTKGLALMPLLTAVPIVALGVNAFGMEYRHRTITTTLLTLQSRAWIVAAKALVVAALAAVTAGIAAAVDYLGVLTIGQTEPDPGRALATAGATVLYVVLTGLVGLALAGLIRNAVAALSIAVLWPGVLEPLLLVAFHLDPWALPFTAAKQLAGAEAGAHGYEALPLLALTALLLAGSTLALSRRDV
jgi:ABC-2 type transport system permease protein